MNGNRVEHAIRVALVALGAAGSVYGLYLLLTMTKPTSVMGLAVWMLGAIILHDALLSPIVFMGTKVLKRLGRGRTWVSLAILQVAVALAAVLGLVALPAIVAKARGGRNPTVVNLDYTTNLLATLAVIAVLAVLGLVILRLRAHNLTRVPDIGEMALAVQQRDRLRARKPKQVGGVVAGTAMLTTAGLVVIRLIRGFRR